MKFEINLKNCYGIKDFKMKEQINFDNENAAIIYAPNGVMKTSLSLTFNDIANGTKTSDRIYNECSSFYDIKYYDNIYNSMDKLSKHDNLYIVKTYEDTFIPSNESYSLLLSDENLRKQYNNLLKIIFEKLQYIQNKLINFSGISINELDKVLSNDLNLDKYKNSWIEILKKLKKIKDESESFEFLNSIRYIDLLNDKTEKVIKNSDMINIIDKYTKSLNEFLDGNAYLSKDFNDYNAETLGKTFKSNDLFKNKHTIKLKNKNNVDDVGITINSLKEWNDFFTIQIKEMYKDENILKQLKALNKLLLANEDTRNFRNIIMQHKEIIQYLSDIKMLKKYLWTSYINNINGFDEYCNEIFLYSDKLENLYNDANNSKEKWDEIVDEFNNRFKVPFKISIENKSKAILKGDEPAFCFKFDDENDKFNKRHKEFNNKKDFEDFLSEGEKRALYLLYILFDIEKIKKCAKEKKCLIIFDDIADSFDYKNKYAIIEYLYDIVNDNKNINALILTHNFDFYRTVSRRLDIKSQNRYMAQKNQDGEIKLEKMYLLNDYFNSISKERKINTDEQKIKLIVSIPFYRNICNYINMSSDIYKKLTCFLHIKNEPLNTENLTLKDACNIIESIKISSGENEFKFIYYDKENYLELLYRLANNIKENTKEIKLENKIFLSIAIRLKLEKFLKDIIISNDPYNNQIYDVKEFQTRAWSKIAKPFLNEKQNKIIDEVNIITSENIHINSFMYEPIIDISDWTLKKLYKDISKIQELK